MDRDPGSASCEGLAMGVYGIMLPCPKHDHVTASVDPKLETMTLVSEGKEYVFWRFPIPIFPAHQACLAQLRRSDPDVLT